VLAQFSVRKLITETWYLYGGYRYAWADQHIGIGTAQNHGVFIALGFAGRPPERLR
jgi:hypothetical protein